MKFDFVSGIKKGIDGIKLVQKVMKAIDLLDDDLDGDGKSQLVNIGERLNELAHLVVTSGLQVFREASDSFGAIKLQAGEIMRLIHELADHVIEGKK